MDFTVSAKMEDLLARVRAFVREELYPLEPQLLSEGFGALLPVLQEKRKKVRALGLALPQIEKEHGGLGLSVLEHGLVQAELAKSPVGVYCFNCQAPDAGNMEILIKFGTPEQKEKYLKPLLAGEIRSCFSMTEPDFPGSNPTWMGTTAVKDGDDYLINGRKWFTSSADGANFAIVMAVTNPEAPKHLRASQIIVPLDTPGFTLVENISCMGHRGEDWDSHAEVNYENVRVPQTNRLGEEGAGFLIAQERLGPGRIHHCMRCIGAAEKALELAIQRGLARTAFRKPLIDLGGNRERIAECRVAIDQARLLTLQAAWKIDTLGVMSALTDVSAIKVVAPTMLQNVVDFAIQMHGGAGVSHDTPLTAFFNQARSLRLADGPDEVHKGMIARLELMKYGVKR